MHTTSLLQATFALHLGSWNNPLATASLLSPYTLYPFSSSFQPYSSASHSFKNPTYCFALNNLNSLGCPPCCLHLKQQTKMLTSTLHRLSPACEFRLLTSAQEHCAPPPLQLGSCHPTFKNYPHPPHPAFSKYKSSSFFKVQPKYFDPWPEAVPPFPTLVFERGHAISYHS